MTIIAKQNIFFMLNITKYFRQANYFGYLPMCYNQFLRLLPDSHMSLAFSKECVFLSIWSYCFEWFHKIAGIFSSNFMVNKFKLSTFNWLSSWTRIYLMKMFSAGVEVSDKFWANSAKQRLFSSLILCIWNYVNISTQIFSQVLSFCLNLSSFNKYF